MNRIKTGTNAPPFLFFSVTHHTQKQSGSVPTAFAAAWRPAWHLGNKAKPLHPRFLKLYKLKSKIVGQEPRTVRSTNLDTYNLCSVHWHDVYSRQCWQTMFYGLRGLIAWGYVVWALLFVWFFFFIYPSGTMWGDRC